MPRLSIIIPTFNSAQAIERCLVSVAKQTFRDYEVLIQDGVSCDHTLGLIDAFVREHAGIRVVVRQEPDSGVYDAMNRAIVHAKGEWLYFLGSDDELFDDYALGKMMSSQEVAAHDVLYGDVKVIGDSGWWKSGSIYGGEFGLQRLLCRNICHQSIFYRASLVRAMGGYNTKYEAWADWDLNMRCWAKAPVKHLDVVVATYFSGGMSSKGADQYFLSDVTDNVAKYFGLTIDSPMINTPDYIGFYELTKIRGQNSSYARRLYRYLRAWARQSK